MKWDLNPREPQNKNPAAIESLPKQTKTLSSFNYQLSITDFIRSTYFRYTVDFTEIALMNPVLSQKRKQKMRKNIDKKNRLLLSKIEDSETLPPQQGSWLLRLFESKLFDMPIAISYLFNSKEGGVLAYLGNKLFVRFYQISFL